MYLVVFTKQAKKDAQKLKSSGLDKKAKELIAILSENPFQKPPQYEALVGDLSGLYSRRINIKHRMVYSVDATPLKMDGTDYDGHVKVLRMWTYYDKI